MNEVCNRRFDIGDYVICAASGVIGKCVKFYVPTADRLEQTLVITDDGRQYHAPTIMWRKINGYLGRNEKARHSE